ncbi:NupC/NupG family nucleoside CNT transporter [Thalassobaculum salexigens]|uniref:NupC/NupG family nucleoside CNT transporter n=1 Tax=Thalassobaculum salexigens TaxID=455360 RepID=UPI00248EC380|nr:nucleoside transporter C-terminal domain-containing protein [Thalassobaculum salexigens]
MAQLHSGIGLLAIFAIAWALSEARRAVGWRVPLVGIVLQIGLALAMLKVAFLRDAVAALNDAFLALQSATKAGTSLVFGYLGGAPLPFEESYPGAAFVLAFQALPLVIVVSALTSALIHLRILPWIVRGFAAALERAFGVGGPVGLACAANVFFGMVEAPVLARDYLSKLDRGELFIVMTTGMATIAGTVLALYGGFVAPVIENGIGHLITASLISVPAAIAIAAIMVPRRGPPTPGELEIVSPAANLMDAITQGTEQGLKLFLSILAMLLVMVALVSLVDTVLGLLPDVQGQPVSLGMVFGWLFSPLVWLIGIPWAEAGEAGRLMGIKTALNELLAYLELSKLPEGTLSERSELIMLYALCGFANFGSLGIMIGGLATILPARRGEIAGLAPKSLVAGTLSTLSTGAVVGLI